MILCIKGMKKLKPNENNIQNIHEDWPMDNLTFRKYLLDKYKTEEAIEEVHHYETSAFKDGYVRTVIPD